jgi:hypothetical protein
MSNYDTLLAEAKSTVTGTAKHYIPKLYEILTKEENKPPEEARNIIEHDLALYWTKAIISRHLPEEAKDKNKVKAGKAAAEITNLVLAEGQSVTTESDDLENVRPDSNDNNSQNTDQDDLIEYQKEKIAELEDALHKTEQFKPATQLQPKEEESHTHCEICNERLMTPDNIACVHKTCLPKKDDINNTVVKAGVGAIENLIRLEIPKLRNRGWKTVEITMRAV